MSDGARKDALVFSFADPKSIDGGVRKPHGDRKGHMQLHCSSKNDGR
jgi:hypothetical protein